MDKFPNKNDSAEFRKLVEGIIFISKEVTKLQEVVNNLLDRYEQLTIQRFEDKFNG